MVQQKAKHLYEAILVDVSNTYYAAFETSHAIRSRLPDGSEMAVGGIVTFLKMVAKVCRDNLVPQGSVFFLCDSSFEGSKEIEDKRSYSIRQRIDPTYKENRRPHPDPSFYRGLELTLAILSSYRDSSFIVRISGCEADDLVLPVLDRHVPSPRRALLMSTDDDWCRSMSERIDAYRHGQVFTVEDFEAKHGYSPKGESIKIYKSFRGDSDGVPKGVEGIREKDLIRLISDFPTLEALKKGYESVDYLSQIWKDMIRDGWPRIQLNYELVDFLPISDFVVRDNTMPCFFRPRALRALYDSLGLKAANVDPRVANDGYARQDPTQVQDTGSFFIKKKLKRI